jgi:hypothetical protein
MQNNASLQLLAAVRAELEQRMQLHAAARTTHHLSMGVLMMLSVSRMLGMSVMRSSVSMRSMLRMLGPRMGCMMRMHLCGPLLPDEELEETDDNEYRTDKDEQ